MEWTDLLTWLEDDIEDIHISRKKENFKEEMMVELWNHDNIKTMIHYWLGDHCKNRDSKSVSKAQSFKAIGNKQFQTKQYIESIQSYTNCALYAPEDSCELPIAYANRSASLFYLNRYEDCIKDIKLAVKLNYPKKLHHKIYLRALQCYLKLGEEQLADETLLKIREMIHDPVYIAPSMIDSIEKKISEMTLSESNAESKKENISRLSKMRSQITFEENVNFPSASTSVDRKCNGKFGRYVAANRLIKKGEILFIEEPVTIMIINQDLLHDRCHYCSRSTRDVPVPCKTCLYTSYCCEECLNQAWSSCHRWECVACEIGILRKIGLGHLTLKAFLTCSTTEDKVQRYEMENLITNIDSIHVDSLKGYGVLAIMLTRYLSEYTSFFDEVKFERSSMSKLSHNTSSFNDEQFHVSFLLLKYLLQIISNGYTISNSDVSLESWDHEFVATAIYLSASLINHSCDPNTYYMFVDQYLIIRAWKDILPGEEVFNSYGPNYRFNNTKERQWELKNYFNFTCMCNACTQPDLQQYAERTDAMKCLKCGGALCDVRYCRDCGDKPRYPYLYKLQQATTIYEEAKVLFDAGKLYAALCKLHECLHIRTKLLYTYNKDVLITWSTMTEVYFAMGQPINGIKCENKVLAALRKRYGSDTGDVFSELNLLTDLCLAYLEKESNTNTNTYRIVAKQTEDYLNQLVEVTDFKYGGWSKIYEDVKTKEQKIIHFLKYSHT